MNILRKVVAFKRQVFIDDDFAYDKSGFMTLKSD